MDTAATPTMDMLCPNEYGNRIHIIMDEYRVLITVESMWTEVQTIFECICDI
jgi:hypothetical protein